MSNYANAADVLPPRLLEEVRKHWRGYIWIPGGRLPGQKSDAVTLIQSGMDAGQICAALGISRSRVYQIARSLGAQNPLKRNPPRASAEEERRETPGEPSPPLKT